MSHVRCCTALLLVAMATYPGPFCEKVNLSTELLNHQDFPAISPNVITNGLVFELKNYYDNVPELLSCLQKLNPAFVGTNTKSLQMKIKRLLDVKLKLTTKRKVKGFESVTDCLEKHFQPPSVINVPSSNKGDPKPITDSFLDSLSVSQLRPDGDEPTIPRTTETATATSDTLTQALDISSGSSSTTETTNDSSRYSSTLPCSSSTEYSDRDCLKQTNFLSF